MDMISITIAVSLQDRIVEPPIIAINDNEERIVDLELAHDNMK